MDLPSPTGMAACRKCGTLLSREKHSGMRIDPVQIISEYDDDGRRERRVLHNVSETQVACPNCGEARPLPNKAAARDRIIFLVAFFGIAAGLLSILIFA